MRDCSCSVYLRSVDVAEAICPFPRPSLRVSAASTLLLRVSGRPVAIPSSVFVEELFPLSRLWEFFIVPNVLCDAECLSMGFAGEPATGENPPQWSVCRCLRAQPVGVAIPSSVLENALDQITTVVHWWHVSTSP